MSADRLVVREVETNVITVESKAGAIASEGMGVIVHGSTAGMARGTAFAQYIWIGSVEPTHMAEHDLWVEG